MSVAQTVERKLWRRFLTEAKDSPAFHSWAHGARLTLQGKCCQAATILAQTIGGKYCRGVYAGPITRDDLFLRLSLNPDGTMGHSWVEKNGLIYDPTWWAFTNAPLGIYLFSIPDVRYRKGENQ